MLKLKEKLNMDIDGLIKNGPINIVAFGDSVTHGALNGCNDYETVYWNVLKKKLNAVRDSIPVNTINSGIGGITAKNSIARMNRDVVSYHPDLVIVCFGLNDVNGSLEEYVESLKTIFTECKKCNAEVLFMTPNMLNTYVAEDTPAQWKEYAAVTAKYQNEGRMDEYIISAVSAAREMDITVCDCYSEWKKLYQNGVDTTQLLINRINHPNREMHQLFADMLFDLILDTEENISSDYANTMFKGD